MTDSAHSERRLISRRSLLIGGSGLLAAYAVGCGGDDEPNEPTASPSASGHRSRGARPSATPSPAPTPGVMRWQTARGVRRRFPPVARDHSLVIGRATSSCSADGTSGEPLGDLWTFDSAGERWLQHSGQTGSPGHVSVTMPSPMRSGKRHAHIRRASRWLLLQRRLGSRYQHRMASARSRRGPAQRYGAASAARRRRSTSRLARVH